MIILKCFNCNKDFFSYPCRIKKGKSNFCNLQCKFISQKGKPTWNTGTKDVMKPNKTSFQKGQISWNKGKKLSEAHKKKLSENHADFCGEKSYAWKGEKAGYFAKHNYIQRIKGKAKKCENCGKTGNGHQMHWSNIDHKYSRNPDDYKSLCVSCHQKHDIKHNGFKMPNRWAK